MATFDTWDSYLYPPPHDTTLRNIVGVRDAREFDIVEQVLVGARGRQLEADPALVAQTFDAGHVRAIHQHLFQDVYEWAGEYRTVNMAKAGADLEETIFAEVRNGEIPAYLEEVKGLVASTSWSEVDRDDFARRSAEVFATLNIAHPFREGNGRTNKVFLSHVAEQSPWQLDFARVPRVMWNRASELTAPEHGQWAPNPEPMRLVFSVIAEERPAPAIADDRSEGQRLLEQIRQAPRVVRPRSPREDVAPEIPDRYRPGPTRDERGPGMGL